MCQFFSYKPLQGAEPDVVGVRNLFQRFDPLLRGREHQDLKCAAREQALVSAGFLKGDVSVEFLL